MKRQFARLSGREQAKVESEYHRKKPEDFDQLMVGAISHSPDAIRLPRRMVATLKAVAETEGEPEYETIVKRWLEERLRKETKRAGKAPKKSYSKKAAVRRHVVK